MSNIKSIIGTPCSVKADSKRILQEWKNFEIVNEFYLKRSFPSASEGKLCQGCQKCSSLTTKWHEQMQFSTCMQVSPNAP